MLALAHFDPETPRPSRPYEELVQDLSEILTMRDRALASQELFCVSPVIRALIEQEIPRLVLMLAQQRTAASDPAR